MPLIEEYLENAPKLAQEVVNDWGLNMHAGNGSLLSEEFLALNEYACRYITAKDIVANHRTVSGVVTDEDAAREAATRRTFAEAYKKYWEKVSARKAAKH